MERRTLLLYSDERLGHPKRWIYWSKFQAHAHMHTPPVNVLFVVSNINIIPLKIQLLMMRRH